MSWIAVAIAGGAIVGAIGSNMAADKQAGAAENAAAIQQNMFNQTVQNEAPYRNAGSAAQNQLNYLLGIGTPSQYAGTSGTSGGSGQGYDSSSGYRIGAGGGIFQGIPGGSSPGTAPTTSSAGGFGSLLSPFTMDTFKQFSPYYDFQKQQGMQGVLNADASGAGALSGAAQKDLMGFNQGLANSAWTNAFNQYQTQQGNIYARLAGVAQTGQAAASNQATGASNFGASIGQQVANVGSAQAGGIVGATNSLGSLAALPWLNAGAGGAPASVSTSSGGSGVGVPN